MATLDDRSAPTEDTRFLLPLVLADDLTEGLVVIDRESVIRYVNPAMTRIFGYGRDELEGAELTTLMPEEYRRRHTEALDRYLSTGERSLPWSEVELPGLHRDGHRLDLRISFSELHWRGRRMFAATIRNLTDPRSPEEEQRILARSYRALFEENVAAVFRTAPDGRLLGANGALARMAGLDDPSALRGRDVQEFYAPGEGREAFLRDLQERREVRNRELQLRRADGTTVWSLVNAVWIDDPTDAEPEALVGTVVDISDRKRAERELERSREALERTEEKFETVFEVSPVAIAIADLEGDRFVEANPAFERLFGYELGELGDGEVGPTDVWADPDERAAVVRRLREGETVRNREVRFRRKDGTPWDALFSATVATVGDEEFLVGGAQDVSHLKEVERQLEHRSLHDQLTGLPNRALFWDRLEHALRRARRTDERVAVLFLDLDGFKRVNDEHGHAAGDEVLRRVADRLRSAVREADTLARLGGDEFGVLLEDLSGESDAVEAARRLTDRFEPAVPVAGEEALLHVSCGIAVAGNGDPGDGAALTADDLVHRADRAMYLAKEEPGSSARVFGPEVEGKPTGRLQREIELKEAVEAGRVVPHFQPIVDLEDGRLVGAEALARWERPGQGLVGPGEFIPLAEETGLIVDLGRSVLRSACRQLADWRDEGILPSDFRLHVNLSARELDRPDVVERLDGMFLELGLEPESVAFEVTESVAIESAPVLDEIRELGSPVAVDDFGTQYATLERLATLELDSLKLDRLFVGGIGRSDRHEAVLEASLTLAESLGLCPVAEGVETPDQRDGLLERGCRYAQGFMYARPAPADRFRRWLAEGRVPPVGEGDRPGGA